MHKANYLYSKPLNIWKVGNALPYLACLPAASR